MNWVPQSKAMSRGTLCRENTWLTKNCAVSDALNCELQRIKMTPFVKKLDITRMASNPAEGG